MITESRRIAQGRVSDALRWVAQEAEALKFLGVPLPKGNCLHEALEQLGIAVAELDLATNQCEDP